MGQLLFGLLGLLTSSVFLSVKEGLQACCNKHVFTSICTKHAVHREHDGVVQFQTWNQAQCQPISLSSLQQQSFQLLQEAANMWLQVQSMKIRPLTTLQVVGWSENWRRNFMFHYV
ncbi:unnamed protein product [Sphagnum jensenii]|uniref:Uncharacterized protein n=1 Tax=Sphagnum jensenii TaxID=128206 RepID=A0ABP0XLI7_9BRYO